MKGVYITGKLEAIGELAALGPHFAKAVAFLKGRDLAALPVGRNEIDGDNCWANVDEIELKSPAEKKPEVHHRYFDIQIPLLVDEVIGVARFDRLAKGSFDAERDIGFYDQPVEPIEVKVGEYALLYPETCAHAPGCSLSGPRAQRKIIVKVKSTK